MLRIFKVLSALEGIVKLDLRFERALIIIGQFLCVTHIFNCAFWLTKEVSSTAEEMLDFLAGQGIYPDDENFTWNVWHSVSCRACLFNLDSDSVLIFLVKHCALSSSTHPSAIAALHLVRIFHKYGKSFFDARPSCRELPLFLVCIPLSLRVSSEVRSLPTIGGQCGYRGFAGARPGICGSRGFDRRRLPLLRLRWCKAAQPVPSPGELLGIFAKAQSALTSCFPSHGFLSSSSL
jgi:hypothetical protein